MAQRLERESISMIHSAQALVSSKHLLAIVEEPQNFTIDHHARRNSEEKELAARCSAMSHCTIANLMARER